MIVEQTPDGMFVLDPINGNFQFMNRLGTWIFQLIQSGHDMDQMMETLTQEYPDTDSYRIESDLVHFIDLLEQKGIVCRKDQDKESR